VAHASDATVVATDISEDALVIARANAIANAVKARVSFVCTSYLEGVAGLFDVITANPPYVRAGDAPGLGRAVRQEPAVALFGGEDGLRDINAVLDAATLALKPEGWFLMEFGYGQEDDVRRFISSRQGLYLSHVRTDLQGIPRMVSVRRTT
jgi:release factor glutamine methyltransferase